MSLNGSDSKGARPLHPAVALLVALLGAAAMFGAVVVLGGRLSLRPLLLVASALLATPAVLALALSGRPVAQTLALQRIDRRTAVLAALLGLSLWGASLGLLELQSAVWPPPPGYLDDFRKIHEALRPHGVLDAIFSVLAIAAGPALFEEMLVRGALLPSWRPRLGSIGAVVATAVAFALMHDPYRRPFTFALGLALGAIRLRSGGLVPCMLVHGTFNSLTLLAAPLVDDPSVTEPQPRPLFGMAMLVAGLLVSFVFFRRLRPSVDRPGGST